MQQLSFNLILGIVSGLVATFLTMFIRSYWNKVILPWYEERIYKDAHIEGKWLGEFSHSADEHVSHYIFNIRRESHHISGEMISKDSGTLYTLQGEFRNMILTLTYTSTILRAVDRGCFTFLLTNNGRELAGYGAFYYSPTRQIETASIKLSLQESENVA